jgi:hypothetical protein
MVNDKTFNDPICVLTCDSSSYILHIVTTVETPILNTELLIFTGMRFGLMQTKVGLVSLLSKYQFSVSKKTPIPLAIDPKSFNLSPLGGMWLQIRKRVE